MLGHAGGQRSGRGMIPDAELLHAKHGKSFATSRDDLQDFKDMHDVFIKTYKT